MIKLTAAQFVKKYPDAEINQNCLEDMGCSKCGERSMFHIQFSGMAEVHDEGSEDAGDHEWEDTSICRCSACDAEGSVKNFTIEGLDDLLAGKKEEVKQ